MVYQMDVKSAFPYGTIEEEVVLSGMESLKRMLHVTNILSAGYLTTPQMVLNSSCLTHIKNWLVQIKQSLGRIIADMDADQDMTLKDVVDVAKDVQDAQIKDSLDVQGRASRASRNSGRMIVEKQVGEGVAKVNVEYVPTAGVAAEGAASVTDDEVPAAVGEPSIPSPPPPTQPPLPLQDIPSTSKV
nr:hypothetical protein [Tanacetum cinerariifolium]